MYGNDSHFHVNTDCGRRKRTRYLMAFLSKSWNLETKTDHLTHLSHSVKMDDQTAHLHAPLADVLATANAVLAESKRLRLAQLEALCKVNALDRKMDIQASSLSHAARQAERLNPALRVLGSLFPDGVTAVTRPTGRGIEPELQQLKRVFVATEGMPEAAVLAPVIEELRTTVLAAETALHELKAIDEQVETNDRLCDDTADRVYNAYYATKGELMKIFNNNKRFINSFFLNS